MLQPIGNPPKTRPAKYCGRGSFKLAPNCPPTSAKKSWNCRTRCRPPTHSICSLLRPFNRMCAPGPEYVLSEIVAALEWWLDDGVDDTRDQQLAALRAEYSDGSTSAATLAAELSDYAALARQESAGLQGLGGFELTLIDEAENLARQLRERPTTPVSPETTRKALDLRNRIGTLLVEHMAQVRAAARFVFRNFPEIAREASSAFERRRRNARRSADKDKTNGQSDSNANAPEKTTG